jgi:O-methyltransferase
MNIVKEVRDNILTEVDDTRCNHLYSIMEEIRDRNIPGDLVETGVYKGGTSMIMAYCNKEFKLNKRQWLCDSFKGCPDPTKTILGRHPDEAHGEGDFACDQQTVAENFRKYDLITPNLVWVPGWFEDTMPVIAKQIDQISLLRFDGDLYSSTLDVLNNLYPKVVSGGFVIIDDYCLEACRDAVNEYIRINGLKVEISKPPFGDACGSWWIKP